MNKLVGLFIGLLFPAFMLPGGGVNQAMADENTTAAPPKDEVKVLVDNDKVQVIEEAFKPGAESESKARPYRVVRAVKGGTLQRIYPDGKKEIAHWKAGEVKVFEATPPYMPKNIGNTEVFLYVVRLK
jgi:hypothetical protein